jgi:hypothetical protein
MNRYIAELIVECRVGRARPTLWDQQLVVLRARGPAAAYAAAMTLGRRQNHAYRNVTGDTVRWSFRGLDDLQELLARSLRSGTEVHSRLFRRRPPRICPKAKLTVFWAERNEHRTASELLSGDLRPFAPR